MSSLLARRQLLRLGAAGAISLASPRVASAAAPPVSAGKRPRYFVSIFLAGGFDAVYTTDPKSRAEVEPWVDVPYASKDILSAGNLQLGPHFAPLVPHVAKLAIVNGIHVNTANHNTGMHQFHRLRTGVSPLMPLIVDLIGDTRGASGPRDGQPLGSLNFLQWDPTSLLGGESAGARSPLSFLEKASPEELRAMHDVLQRQASRLHRDAATGSPQLRAARNADEAVAFLERLPSCPFAAEVWSDAPVQQKMAVALQRALWALRNDLCRSVSVWLGDGGFLAWDTHTFNARGQANWNGLVFPMFARFLDALEKTSNAHGPLLANTVGLVGSEIGRFPKVNTSFGKDHFPEAPFVFFGGPIAGGASYGATSRRMEAQPVSPSTGKPAAGGHRLTLDDVGTTLLDLFGVTDPSVHGYSGTKLDFLRAS